MNMKIVIIACHSNAAIRTHASNVSSVVEIILTSCSFALLRVSSSGLTPSESTMQAGSAKVHTATIFTFDIIVTQASPSDARPITQLSRSPAYPPVISLSPSAIKTAEKSGLPERSFTVRSTSD